MFAGLSHHVLLAGGLTVIFGGLWFLFGVWVLRLAQRYDTKKRVAEYADRVARGTAHCRGVPRQGEGARCQGLKV